MPFFHYEATDSQGQPVCGYQDAATVQAAHDALTRAGHRDIRILDSLTRAAMDDAFHRDQSAEQLREGAEVLRRYQANPRAELRRMAWTAIRQSVAENRAFHLVMAALLLFFLWRGIWLGLAGMVLVYAIPTVLTLRVLGWFDHYRAMEMAQVNGEWNRALALIARLRANKQMCDKPDAGLDFQEAAIRARQGVEVDDLIAGLSPWRERLADQPGAFEARLLGIYLAGGRYDQYLAAARHSLEAAPDDPTRQIDMALAEARFGSVAEARDELAKVNPALLSEGLLICRQWIEGLIALRSADNGRALVELEQVMTALQGKVAKAPKASVPLVLATGAYCLALARSGRKEEAARKLAEAWPLLRLHGTLGFEGMMALLRQEVGVPVTPA